MSKHKKGINVKENGEVSYDRSKTLLYISMRTHKNKGVLNQQKGTNLNWGTNIGINARDQWGYQGPALENIRPKFSEK